MITSVGLGANNEKIRYEEEECRLLLPIYIEAAVAGFTLSKRSSRTNFQILWLNNRRDSGILPGKAVL